MDAEGPDGGPAQAPYGAGLKVVVVEDDPVVRETVQRFLQADGFTVHVAADGRVGADLVRAVLPDLVVCDVAMPVLDGHGLLAELRGAAATEAIPFIFLSARGEVTDLREGMNRGADDYLPKPFRKADLLHAVRTRLRRRRATEAAVRRQLADVENGYRPLVYQDGVTGLPNRLALREQFEALRSRAAGVVVVVLGMDRYDHVVDGLGWAEAEALLRACGELVQAAAAGRPAARLQADRFVLLLEPPARGGEEGQVAALLSVLSRTVPVGGRPVAVRFNAGVAVLGRHGQGVEELVQAGTRALIAAGRRGGGAWQLAAAPMAPGSAAAPQLENGIRDALRDDQFLLHYQPKMDPTGTRLAGAEALIRWCLPDGAFIPPAEFIPVAEQSDLIIDVGNWVLRRAMTQVAAWERDGLHPPHVAVNVSARQLERADFLEGLRAMVQQAGLPAGRLQLEITESAAVGDLVRAAALLARVRELGFRVALDDFGTGYSSLGYLSRLPLDELKLDRTFVVDLPVSERARAIVRAVIEMAHGVGLIVVAEGVETREQLAVLAEHGCDLVQGYLFSRPIPARDMEQRCRDLLPPR